MTRFLFAAMPAAGHVGPMIPLAHELVARGHEVAWYTGERYRDKVEATGATFLPQLHAMRVDVARLDDDFPVRAQKKGVRKFIHDMREVFIKQVPGQVDDLEDHVGEFAPVVLVAEPALGAAALVIDQRHGLKWATCGISALAFPSVDTAPFGFGLRPPPTARGGLRNRAIGTAIDATLFRAVNRDYDAMRRQLGLGPIAGGLFGSTLSPYLYLQPTVPSFGYPPSGLPPQVPRAAGPLRRPAAPAGAGRLRGAVVVGRAVVGAPGRAGDAGHGGHRSPRGDPPGARGAARRAGTGDRRDRRAGPCVARRRARQRPRRALRPVRRAHAARVRLRDQRRLRRAALRTRARRSGGLGRQDRGQGRARRAGELERRRCRHEDPVRQASAAAPGGSHGAV